ncbi:MAG: leucyl aminopeptidase family protein [Burkholderiaceae bacterium]|nr:leucyl aminopeptidase family protein [Rhodoferax sp.]MCP5270336.1 leucyl aminopeptidase family protein [Burkholderiaceae bacterium]
MTVELKTLGVRAVPVHVVDRASFATHLRTAPATTQRWLKATGFQGEADRHVLVPGADGGLHEVWAGVSAADSPWALAALPTALPPGTYRIADDGLEVPDEAAALSWELGGYAFDTYKPTRREPATLQLAPSLAAERGLMLATAIASVRDLVNTPAEHMGPAELAAAVKLVAKQHGAKVKETAGDALLKANFPAIHAVGRAAARAPRLIELTWGSPKHPKLSIVGKGVCFDSGGLDLKSADGMRLMKKDMGGAANALGLAQMIMALKLPVRLQLLIPAVENAVSGNAFRPGDVFRTRSGLHIEIGNTDAEGRVILCDALAYAAESKPEVIIDLATLTGAARTALGPALPALFCRDTALARQLVDSGLALQDPLWHMPLWADYHAGIESPVADIVNTGRNAMGGAISAALFLADFVPADLPWLHIDLFSWNDQARPGRPVGGEAQTLRTLLHWLETRFG